MTFHIKLLVMLVLPCCLVCFCLTGTNGKSDNGILDTAHRMDIGVLPPFWTENGGDGVNVHTLPENGTLRGLTIDCALFFNNLKR